ncbi:type 1 glutamine amidotransferase domain-containing protein [Psychrobium sp. nBUS_13]|uniref:type 1 glutamine amidotransferase domain-containing protein n=1 Tax=Psychrobium sp. nBUS_13 TaxID=3395319 RepID=UPI003EBEB942
MTKKHILMVLTSHDKLGNSGEKTGFWVEEFAAPYFAFKDAGYEITLASPLGGQPPIDPKSELADFQTADTQRFDNDEQVKDQLSNTLKLNQVNASDYDAVFYPGGHGPLWDLVDDVDSIALIQSTIEANKPVATVCHSSAVLLNIKDNNDAYLINKKAVSGFTNNEEAAVELTQIVPFLLEDELIKRGADYQRAADWTPFAVQDGLIISGQNPASSALVAQKLITHLNQ